MNVPVRKTFFAILSAACLLTGMLWAQATSQITGTVHDPSGGAVPGATVRVTQTDTGFTSSMVTNGEGDYVLPNLPVGPYRLEVTKDGFSKYVQANLVLEVNVNPSISPVLKVGSVSDTVTVEAEALQVETHDTGVGQVIDHDEVAELPLNARDPTQLILLAGNATIQGVSANDLNSNKNFPTITISVSGQPNADTIAFSLDGATANEPFNGLNQPLPFPDALQEFKVETSAVGAQVGQHAAASVSVVTRSGTNSFHGNVFDYVRNYEFNARNSTALVRDSLKQNQFGGTIGGPIKKNKLFFFVGEQSTIKRSNPATNTGYSMTPAMLAGDFTAVASTAFGCQTTSSVTIQNAAGNWVGNTLSPSLMNPIAVKIAKYLPPASNLINQCGQFYYASGANDRQYQIPVKLDYNINSSNSLFVRYQLSNNLTPTYVDPTDVLFTGATTGQLNNIQSTVIGENYTIRPTLFSSTHIEANRSLNTRFIYDFAVPAQFGIPITAQIPGETTISVSNGFTTGGSGAANPGYFNTLTYSGAQDFTWVHGKHQLQFGVQFIRAYMHAQNTRGVNGNLSFTGQFSNSTNTTGIIGEGYADFLTGQMNGFSQGRPFYDDDQSNYYGFYAQDAWRATSHLTVNLGLRFEPFRPQNNTDNYIEFFSYANYAAGIVDTPPKANPVLTPPAGLIFSGDPGAPPNQTYEHGSLHFEPRAGIAWDPFGDGKTSIRISGGLLYDNPHMFFYTRVSNNPPWGATVNYNSGVDTPLSNPWAGYPGGDPFLTAANASTGGSGKNFGFFPTAGTYAVSDPNLKANQVGTWNMTIQRTMRNWLLSVAYLGNHGAHLWTSTEDNPVVYIPGTCAAGVYGLKAAGNCSSTANYANRRTLQLLNPTWASYYSTIAYVDGGATSSYNGAEMTAQHRLGNNFSALANWTWSHALCDPVTTEVTGPTYEIPGNRNADYSNCANDHRQQINISGVLQSPKMSDRFLNMLIYGWQVSPIYHWSTGNLGTIVYGNDAALINTSNQRAQQIASNIYGAGGVNGYGYINPAAFLTDTTEVAGAFAPTRPFTVSNPDVWNIDASLSRNFRIRENKTLTFRAEAFNLTNSVMWGNVNANVASSTFGKLAPGIVQSTASGGTQGRIMQFALKFAF